MKVDRKDPSILLLGYRDGSAEIVSTVTLETLYTTNNRLPVDFADREESSIDFDNFDWKLLSRR
jgi:hypothetical protein